jgi:hypothetical protein
MAIEYYAGDERPYWQPTIEVEGVAEDFSSGFTFEVNVAATATSTPVVTKTSGISGFADGLIVVAWAVDDLAIAAGRYVVQLTATRTSDSRDFTIQDTLKIKPRLT